MLDTPELLQGLLKFSEYASKIRSAGRIDLCQETLSLTTLVPLLNFIEESDATVKCTHSKSTIIEDAISRFKKEENIELPNENCYAVKLAPAKETNAAIDLLDKVRDKNCQCGGENAFKLLVGELMDNIYQHSQFTNAYIFGQKYTDKKFVELTFFDNGISIPGSYKNRGFHFTDNEAIREATLGFSTKGEERGRGLPYMKGLVLRGLEGEMLIASGKAALYDSFNLQPSRATLDFEFVKEPPFKGTLISIRMPFSTKVIDYADFA